MLANETDYAYADGMNRVNHGILPRVIGLGVLLAAVPLAGCARQAGIVLQQPMAPPSQQSLKLTSDWAYRAVDELHSALALTFPLPGAAGGPRAFVLYVSAPDGRQVAFDPQAPDGARGFLIQELGALAGRSDFVAGTLRVRPVLFSPRLHRVDLNVRCDDGTEISGTAIVEDVPRQVQIFEREFAADVARLSISDLPQAASSEEPEEPPAAARGTAARNLPTP